MSFESPSHNNETPKMPDIKGMMEGLGRDVFKPLQNLLGIGVMAGADGQPGIFQNILNFISKFTDALQGKAPDATRENGGQKLMDIAREHLKIDKLMDFHSPNGRVGCADFVSFAMGLHKYENGQLIKNTNVLKDPNTNTVFVPSLVQEFRRQQFKEVTDPKTIHEAISKGLPVGGIVVLGNSYTDEDEDHILVAAEGHDGKTVVLNNSGNGVVRVRTDLMTASDPDKIRTRQEAFRKNGKGGIKRDPVVTKLFLPPEAA